MYQVTLGLVEHLPEETQARIIQMILDESAKNVAPVTYKVLLVSFGQNKIGAIKAIREVTGLGLKDSKDITDRVDAFRGVNSVIAKDLTEERADVMFRTLRDKHGLSVVMERA